MSSWQHASFTISGNVYMYVYVCALTAGKFVPTNALVRLQDAEKTYDDERV